MIFAIKNRGGGRMSPSPLGFALFKKSPLRVEIPGSKQNRPGAK